MSKVTEPVMATNTSELLRRNQTSLMSIKEEDNKSRGSIGRALTGLKPEDNRALSQNFVLVDEEEEKALEVLQA